MQDLSKARESLVGAETSRKHLQERVDELSRQLQGNEEKLSVYERRSTAVGAVSQGGDKDLSREQQFEAEVAELRWVRHISSCSNTYIMA
jgi:nucleoprotein TPR